MSLYQKTVPTSDVFTAAMLPADYPSFDGSQPCYRTENKDAFFPAAHDGGDAAKRICRGCPFQQPCGSYALAHPEVEGVWAAMTEKERKKIRRRRAA